jgi:hypothetical protein
MADIEITGPDGSSFSFPEGTSHGAISAAMQKHYGSGGGTEPSAKRYAGIAGRAVTEGVVEGVGAIPALASDAAYNAYVAAHRNLITPTDQSPQYGMPVSNALSEAASGAANAMNLPVPVTDAEKVLSGIGKGGVSALTGGGVFGMAAKGAKAVGAASGVQKALGAMGSNLGQQAAAGAVGGGVTSGLEAAGADPLVAAAGGLVAAPLAVGAARRVVTPLPSTLSPEQQRLAQVFQSEVGPLSAGQQTGSSWLRTAEDQTSKLPMGDLLVSNPTANQREQFTSSVLKRAGIDAEAATPDVLNQAHKDLGQVFNDIPKKYNIGLDSNFSGDISNVLGTYGKNLSTDQRSTIESYVRDMATHGGNLPPGTLSGETYQKTRSNIGRAIRQQNGLTGDPEYRNALIGLQDALDGAFERTLTRANPNNPDIAAMADARQKYANLMTIESAVARSGKAGAEGMFTPQALAGSVKSAVGPRNYARGVGDMNDLAKAGASFLPAPADSGTASRLAGPAYIGGIITGAQTAGTKGALTAASLPIIAQLGINSPVAQMYWRNQMLAGRNNVPAMMQGGLLGSQGQ